MSTESPVIEIADEALKKLEGLNVVDQESQEKESAVSPRVRLTEEERRRLWMEKQALKPVVETGIKGKVKWYSIRNHYGFIARDDGSKDVFVHQTAISKSHIVRYFLRTLAEGEEVVFDIVDGDKGPEAANVCGPDGADVKGSKYFRILLRPRHRASPQKDGEQKRGGRSADDEKEKTEETKKRRRFRKRHNSTKKSGDERTKKGGDAGTKKNEDDASKKSEDEKDVDVEPKPARRRSVADGETPKKNQTPLKNQSKIPSPLAGGDVSLGATSVPSAAVH